MLRLVKTKNEKILLPFKNIIVLLFAFAVILWYN